MRKTSQLEFQAGSINARSVWNQIRTPSSSNGPNHQRILSRTCAFRNASGQQTKPSSPNHSTSSSKPSTNQNEGRQCVFWLSTFTNIVCRLKNQTAQITVQVRPNHQLTTNTREEVKSHQAKSHNVRSRFNLENSASNSSLQLHTRSRISSLSSELLLGSCLFLLVLLLQLFNSKSQACTFISVTIQILW